MQRASLTDGSSTSTNLLFKCRLRITQMKRMNVYFASSTVVCFCQPDLYIRWLYEATTDPRYARDQLAQKQYALPKS